MFGTPTDQLVALSEKTTKVQTSAVPEPVASSVAPAALGQPQTLAGHEVNQKLEIGNQRSAPTQNRSADQKVLAINNQAAPVIVAQVPPDSVKVLSGDVKLNTKDVQINAQTSGSPVKVIAYFGDRAIMLQPNQNGSWTGVVNVSELTVNNSTVKLRAYDINNKTDELQLADFSSGTIQNYNLANTQPTTNVKVLGHNFDPNSAANRFYLFFIAGLLTSLVLAIGIKRHVQHLPLIANASFVIILATMIWWTG
jgi:hypothetical protein